MKVYVQDQQPLLSSFSGIVRCSLNEKTEYSLMTTLANLPCAD